ncbi:MAG: hypothetical protein HQK81_12455 [Desulfovibrionaceae bacterium]|nr:hypothetical protein [Desulfovibrionaceae bacterium]MBF0514855.1 hypothetical protein [Desulfovibrionaceae bacterium]
MDKLFAAPGPGQSPLAVVFSPDVIRGNITSRKLRHEGLSAVLFDRVGDAVDAACAGATRVFVFDTAGALADELRFLSRVCDAWPENLALLIVLGDQPPELPGPAHGGDVRVLRDPLDLERVASLAKQACAGRPAQPVQPAQLGRSGQSEQTRGAEESDLEAELKDFLRLT